MIAGSEVNDDPLAPISRYGRGVLAECGDATPIEWLRRDRRFLEKLATPDVTISDIIGDLVRSRRRAQDTSSPTS